MPASQSDLQLLLDAYRVFNARDIDAALALMVPDVDWPNGLEGGYVHGHEAVRDFWTRQWQTLDPLVHPLAIDEERDGRLIVTVHQVIRALDGQLLTERTLEHVYRLRDGLVEHMEIRESAVTSDQD